MAGIGTRSKTLESSFENIPHSFALIIDKLKGNQAKNVVTMVGAGISTSAGIPDFRSPAVGLLANLNLPTRHAVFDSSFFEKDPKPLYALLKNCMLTINPRPTKAHYFVKLLEDKGLLRRHYTQNIDGLDRLAGVSPDKLVEAHGSLRTSYCTRCGKQYPLSWLKDKLVSAENSVPLCDVCSAVIKPGIVLFGDQLPEGFSNKIAPDTAACDLLIVMGTSLVVEPFASLVTRVPSACSRLFINKTPLGERPGVNELAGERRQIPGSDVWVQGGNRDAIMFGECDDCVEQLARLAGWHDDLIDLKDDD